ncbi:MAG: twin transmembrane helix small protein [Pseudomonadales bacterium]|nr:twin transmembrane helix small protein [Pseudomonadales bacterium]
MLYKILILAILAAILISLFSGAIFLAKDDNNSKRMVTSLTVRISLSILLVVVLVVGFMTGQIQPHGL